jgi:hypothetical protein
MDEYGLHSWSNAVLTPKVREALQAELEHLRIRREHVIESINERIRALEAVLKSDEGLDGGSNLTVQEEGQGGLKPIPARSTSLAGRGLRASIRIVLSDYPTGLFPSDIASRLEELGFKAGGHLSIPKRVYGELYRMRRKGIVSKRGYRYIMGGG